LFLIVAGVRRMVRKMDEHKRGLVDCLSQRNSGTMEPLRIIVAEDEYVIALDLKRKLEGFGCNVLCMVSSGEAAIAKANELQPDLLLMDIGLQGRINGLGAIASIRSTMNIPVVFVTAYSDEATRLEVARLDAAGFVMKPIEANELKFSLEQAFKGSDPIVKSMV
jgi:CheY-like chemotaxis protein